MKENNMKEDLKSLIQQHLPAMAAGEMKTFIEQAEKEKEELSKVKSTLENYKQINEKQAEEVTEHRRLSDAVQKLKLELDEKEKALNQKEFNLKVAELTYQLEAEKKSKDSIFSLVSTFVANPRAIETINKNRIYTHSTDYSPSGGTSHYPTSSFEIETRESREQK